MYWILFYYLNICENLLNDFYKFLFSINIQTSNIYL